MSTLIVFDLDGTLIDSRAALLAAHDAAWSAVGLPRPPDDAILSLVGLSLIQTMQILAPETDPVPLARAYGAAYAQAHALERPFPGVDTLLSGPFRAAVATGKSQRGADRAVQQHGWAPRFELVLGASSVPRPKPYPDMLHAIRQRTGADTLVMVGDTSFDLEMAQAAGAKGIGVAWGHHPAARLRELGPVATTMAELAQLLDAHTAG